MDKLMFIRVGDLSINVLNVISISHKCYEIIHETDSNTKRKLLPGQRALTMINGQIIIIPAEDWTEKVEKLFAFFHLM